MRANYLAPSSLAFRNEDSGVSGLAELGEIASDFVAVETSLRDA